MEKDIKLGTVGDVDVSAAMQSEQAKASVNVGPLKVSLVAELDNRAALDYLASKVPGGFAHDAIVALEKILFPEQPAAQPAQPSA